MDKGSRVEITGGRQGVGQLGTIFWKGPNKYGDGERFGVRGDDGSTYWVLEGDVEESSTEPAPIPESSEVYANGDRVALSQNGQPVTGTVFWIGDSKVGGQRLGIRNDDSEEAIWIDAHHVSRSDSTPAVASPDSQEHEPDPVPAEYSQSLSMDDGPPAPPLDDTAIDAETQWSAQTPEDEA